MSACLTALPNDCCYFTSANEMYTILFHTVHQNEQKARQLWLIQTQSHRFWSMLTTSAVTGHRQLRLGVVGLHGVFSGGLSTKSS